MEIVRYIVLSFLSGSENSLINLVFDRDRGLDISDFVGEAFVDEVLFMFVDKSVRVSDFRVVQDFAHMRVTGYLIMIIIKAYQ